ncbi:cysteine hydrolase family protein [Aneurinibacillus sp. REN35]|uniref:cysteine hydrolase family protein n=1 Tax=Aneurinibacillus sp. REN35 TaxID=3237286 RepID=UPI003526D2FA
MKRALLVIDYTRDFIDGALPVGQPGAAIENRLATITEEAIVQGDYVVFAVDKHQAHDPYHPETTLFPPHNIEGTSGRALYGRLQNIYTTYQDRGNVMYMDKTRYSSFVGTNLEIQLRARQIQEIHLVGVCTDICVLHAAVDAYNKGFRITVHEDAVASFNQVGHNWALQHMKHCLGATICSL